MPFPALTARGFTAKEDSAAFDQTIEDPVVRKEFEGGFVVTRPRFTRIPKALITTGFTNITDADKAHFLQFMMDMRGGSYSFVYVHPVTNGIYRVRFKELPKPKYVGIGPTRFWDIKPINLEEV